MYLKPLELFYEVRLMPDASGPALLLVITFVLQTAIAAQLTRGVYLVSGGLRESLLDRFYTNLAALVSIRAATLFVFWFILFIIYWFIIYIMGSRIEGFTVFSATGYVLSSQLLTFATYVTIYTLASKRTPTVDLVNPPGVYPQMLAWTAYMFRLEEASKGLAIQLTYLLDAVSYFGTVWNVVLTVLLFRILGGLSWKRVVIGSAVALLASWILASIFRAAGML